MKNKKRLQCLSTVLLCLLALGLVQFTGSACGGDSLPSNVKISSWNLVDSGKHCDWDARSSAYHSYVVTGANTWNAYKAGVLRPDSASTLEDVRISDVNKSDVRWAGATYSNGIIHLNKYYMDSYANNKRLMVVTHELGHALGLDDNNCSTSNVMYPDVSTVTTLSVNDKASYDAAYARY